MSIGGEYIRAEYGTDFVEYLAQVCMRVGVVVVGPKQRCQTVAGEALPVSREIRQNAERLFPADANRKLFYFNTGISEQKQLDTVFIRFHDSNQYTITPEEVRIFSKCV